MKTTVLATLAAFALATPLAADSMIEIDDPRAFATPATAMAGGAFMTLTNTGTTDDTLIGVRADFPRVEIHTTEFDGDIARMIEVGQIAVPAGETVTLEPGGLHVMIMGLRDNPLVEGTMVPATLVFEQAGEVEVMFNVIKRTMAGHGHGDQSNDNTDHTN